MSAAPQSDGATVSASSDSSWSFVAASSMKCRWCDSMGETFIIHMFPFPTFIETLDHMDGKPLPLCRDHSIQYSHIMLADADEYSSQLPPPTSSERHMIEASACAWKEFLTTDPASRAFAAESPKIVRNYDPETDPDERADDPEPPWCRACGGNPPVGVDRRDLKELHSVSYLQNRIDHPMMIPEERMAEFAASSQQRGAWRWCEKHIGDIVRLVQVYDPIKFNIRSRVWGPPPK